MMLYILILARLILKEIITIVKLFGVVLSIIGVFLVVQPEVIFGGKDETGDIQNQTNISKRVIPEYIRTDTYSI